MWVAGCSAAPATPSASTTAAAPNTDLAAVVATIGTEPVSLADLEARLRDPLATLTLRYQMDRQRVLEAGLEALLRERVIEAEATRQGTTVEELIVAEADGTLEPSEIELALWFRDNQGRVGRRTLEEIRPQIADLLRKARRDSASQALQDRLYREQQVVVQLTPLRVPLDNDGAPARGPADAPVTLVEFSDFQCPFCIRMVATLEQIQATYGDRVRLIYRQFPIAELHPEATKAAEASLCAHEQDRFWAMHDLLFAEPTRMAVPDLKAKAARLGLNVRRFDACLDGGKFAPLVQRDFAAGHAIGVTGTPALFLNGIPLEGGAIPYEKLAAAIDKELARLR